MKKTFEIKKKITDRQTKSIEKYFNDLNSNFDTDPISKEAERVLLLKAKQGCQASRAKVIQSNLRFVISVAKAYVKKKPTLQLDDLIQEGNIGLLIALDKYDPDTGFKFISYAVWWVKRLILDATKKHAGKIRLPLNALDIASKVQRADQEIYNTKERSATEDEIEDITGVGVESIRRVRSSFNVLSLDKPLSSDPSCSATFLDMLTDTKENDLDNLRTLITPHINKLKPVQKKVVIYFFGIGTEPCTHDQCGHIIGKTAERSRQILKQAISELRQMIQDKDEIAQFVA